MGKINSFLSFSTTCILLLFCGFSVCSVKEEGKKNINRTNFANLWVKYDSLSQAEGLIQSARKVADTIYTLAQKEENTGELIKALVSMLQIDAAKEESAYTKAIKRITDERMNAKEPVAALLNVLLAEYYWQYYQQNRWKFYDRTQVVNVNDEDISTWDLSTLFESVLDAYLKALGNSSSLKKYSVEKYSSIVTNTNESWIKYRPTLFDLIAHRAIDFFSNEEPELTQPSFKFELDSKNYFDSYINFSQFRITTQDTMSIKYHALKLFQELLDFHKNDKDPSALIDIDLKRLEFVKQHSILENREELYLSALERLADKFAKNEGCAEISHRIAQYYVNRASTFATQKSESVRWDYVKAKKICDEMIAKFENSYGAKICMVLRASIIEKNLSFSNETVVPPQQSSKLAINYRNVNKLYWRMIPVTTQEYKTLFEERHRTAETLYLKLSSLKPIHKDVVTLPDPGDFQMHGVEVVFPAADEGLYLILVSADESFQFKNNIISHGTVRYSNISYIFRSQPGGTGAHEYFVRDRESGVPLSGVTANIWNQVYNDKKRSYVDVMSGTYKTDVNGRFVIPAPLDTKLHGNYRVHFSNGNDELESDNNRYLYRNVPAKKQWNTRTFFFTDRSIYRPGQTIYFKGILIKTDGDSNAIVTNTTSTIHFYDVNGQEISSVSCPVNQYGTFNGSFTAPFNVLNGNMTISNNFGSTSISVEEYKRPKFEVSFSPVEGSYRCGDTVTVKGQAKAFSGSPISGAQVNYRVTRNADFPYWWGWWRPRPSSPAMEINHGTAMTNDTGGYVISFRAIPDASIKKSDNPSFTYSVVASVTDVNGETHETTTTVTVAYTAVNVSIEIPKIISLNDPAQFAVIAKNNSGVAVPLKGTIEIHRLETPLKIIRKRLNSRIAIDTSVMTNDVYESYFPTDVYNNEDDWSTWKNQEKVLSEKFDTELNGQLLIKKINKWKQGAYVMKASAVDSYGQTVTDIRYFTLYDENQKNPPYAVADWFVPLTGSVEPGDNARFLAGSSYENVAVLWEVEHNGAIIHSEWFTINNNQRLLEIPIKEKYRGNISAHYTFIRDNRIYTHDEVVQVPWTNKELTVEFETFRDKLQPGQNEEWRLKISGSQKEKVAAEMVISLYDASLDAFRPHGWGISIYPWYSSTIRWDSGNSFSVSSGNGHNDVNTYPGFPERKYPMLYLGNRTLYPFGVGRRGVSGIGYGGGGNVSSVSKRLSKASQASDMEMAMPMAAPPMESASADNVMDLLGGLKKSDEKSVTPDLANVKARSNLNETAFFYPELGTDSNGALIVKFAIPEALTKWKMLGFAHTKDLKYTTVEKELITQKELMVEPNAPRFFRENDTLSFSAKVVNLSDKDLEGSAQLMLFDASTMQPVDTAFSNIDATKAFRLNKGSSAGLFWRIVIPQGMGPVSCRVVAKAANFSDGEEKIIPVLSDRMLVTESMPLPVSKKGTKHFVFDKLVSQNGNSKTLQNYKVTLEFTSNPIWYAIQSLPYLMEYPYECAEQTFARYYANSIATNIMNSNPKIKAIFDIWKLESPDALLSALEKNQELKSLLLEETPWLVSGKNESENKKRLGLLFDLNTMNNQLDRALDRLIKMQTGNGGWPWFDGMPDDRYITQHIITGFGKLDNLNVVDCRKNEELFSHIKRAVLYCDDRIQEDYEWILKNNLLKDDNVSSDKIHYLYARSCFKDIEVNKRNKVAFDYFIDQAEKHWIKKGIYEQGLIACALNRYNKPAIPKKIYMSLKERALLSEEMGMYWKSMYENEGWYWYQAPIETQALLIEMFDEVAHDTVSVEAMKVWLLKSKQTQNWKTTKATTDAIYALLLQGTDPLSEKSSVIIKMGSEVIDPSTQSGIKQEAGTGYFKKTWEDSAIQPSMGNIDVTKSSDGVAWGSVYWQYFERLDKITAHATPLSLKRQLFRQVSTDKGVKLESIDKDTKIKVGDKVTVRVELRSDRDMEYVHMKDMRSSGFEPINVLSGYRYQDGLGYYESTRDASVNFFFSYLHKGTYVFEYPLYVTHSGAFSNGITTIQCMYAPEFTSHSQGMRLNVVK